MNSVLDDVLPCDSVVNTNSVLDDVLLYDKAIQVPYSMFHDTLPTTSIGDEVPVFPGQDEIEPIVGLSDRERWQYGLDNRPVAVTFLAFLLAPLIFLLITGRRTTILLFLV